MVLCKRNRNNESQTLRRWRKNVRNLLFAESGGNERMLVKLIEHLLEDDAVKSILNSVPDPKVFLPREERRQIYANERIVSNVRGYVELLKMDPQGGTYESGCQ